MLSKSKFVSALYTCHPSATLGGMAKTYIALEIYKSRNFPEQKYGNF